jgi:hypothetical protein
MSNEVLSIVDAVLRQTRAGALNWAIADAGKDDEYTANSERFRYYVSSRDGDSQPPFTFEVWKINAESKNKKLIEATSTGPDMDLGPSLSDLIEVARGQASGLGGSVREEILKDLGELF